MPYACSNCGARTDERLEYCPRCGSIRSYWPVVTAPADAVMTDTATKTAKELFQAGAAYLALPADIQAVTGRLPRTPFLLAVYGPPGAGKSTFALRLADALCACLGPVVYNALEEGFSPSMSAKLRWLEIAREDLIFACMNDLGAILEALRTHGARALVLDSLTQSTLTAEDVARLVREAEVSVIYTMHITKAGQAAGRMGLLHVADVILALEHGTWTREKTRYDAPGDGSLDTGAAQS